MGGGRAPDPRTITRRGCETCARSVVRLRGESNRLTTHLRPALLCLGPGREAAAAQARAVRDLGGVAVEATGRVDPHALRTMGGLSGALWWGDARDARAYAQALLVDRAALSGYQDENDAMMASETLKDAFRTDVGPILAMARSQAGGAIDPIATYRAAGYRRKVAGERPAVTGAGGGIV